MAFSQFPAPAAGGAEDVSFAATIPALMTTFEHINDFSAGIYDIVVAPTSTEASITFVDNTSTLLSLTTANGIVSGQLSTPATKVYITTRTGGTLDAIVKISKTAGILTPDDIGNGTLDTITTTGTYNQTGLLSVLAVGGGAGGVKGGQPGNALSGAGGASGGVGLGIFYTNAATTVTVGAAGTAETANLAAVAPTQSSFGNLITSSTNNFFYVSGSGAGKTGYNTGGNPGTAGAAFKSFYGNDTNGGGGSGNAYGGGNSNTARLGGGSGIGTGGSGGGGQDNNTNNTTANIIATAGTGIGAGGGGGASVGNNQTNTAGRFGGDGSNGGVFVLRGF